MTQVAVLGAGGLLGRHVVDELRERAGVRALDHAACDVRRLDEVATKCSGVEVIVNCAAFTNVDGAESHEDEAYRVNALGAENAARVAARLGATMVQVSTDFVFDGLKTDPYDEFDAPNPKSAYARSKWAGEELVQRVRGRLLLVRVQGLYGEGGRNFSSKLREYVLEGRPLRLDGERRVQPTWARAAARQIVRLALGAELGTYHVSCKGAATWAEFAAHIAVRLGVAPAWEEVSTAALQAPAARPPNCLFRHRMLQLRDLDLMPDWRVALDEYLSEEAAKLKEHG